MNVQLIATSVYMISVIKLMLNDLPHIALGISNVDPTKRRELVDHYGSWAVGRAESICPRGDYNCIEREASRLAAIVRVKSREERF